MRPFHVAAQERVQTARADLTSTMQALCGSLGLCVHRGRCQMRPFLLALAAQERVQTARADLTSTHTRTHAHTHTLD